MQPSGRYQKMFNNLANKKFRDAFLEENIRMRLALQIRALREKFKWSQPELATRVGNTQSVISRLEDSNYGKFTIRTLLKLASTFDVALFISFVSYTKLEKEIEDLSPKALAVASYLEEKEAMTSAPTETTSAQQSVYRSFNTQVSFHGVTPSGKSRADFSILRAANADATTSNRPLPPQSSAAAAVNQLANFFVKNASEEYDETNIGGTGPGIMAIQSLGPKPERQSYGEQRTC